MKTKIKNTDKLPESSKKLLKSKNFLNNQNYVLSNKTNFFYFIQKISITRKYTIIWMVISCILAAILSFVFTGGIKGETSDLFIVIFFLLTIFKNKILNFIFEKNIFSDKNIPYNIFQKDVLGSFKNSFFYYKK